MSFAFPWRLVFLLAPLALLIAYVVVQRTRRKYVLRFTSVDLLSSVAPRRPGWQRHIATVLMVAALALLVVGFAHPMAPYQVARQKATVMVVIDTSESMTANDVQPTRLAAAEQSAHNFVAGLPSGLQVGLETFDRDARVIVAPGSDRQNVYAALDQLQTAGGTATGPAIFTALDAIKAMPKGADGKVVPATIVLLSDGTPTIGNNGEDPQQTVTEAVAAAKQANVPVNTIAFGTPNGTVQINGESVDVPADPSAMKQIADGSGGKSFTAQTTNQLKSVYEQIRKVVGYDTRHHDVTAWFIGFSLVVFTLAAIAALVWKQVLL